MEANFMESLNLTIDGNRLWNQLMDLGKIGEGDNGGVTRTSFDQNDIQARKFFLKLLEQADLSPYMDAAGNIFGQIIGKNPELPAILIGSHLDTVNSGGRFDGAMGVLMGVEVLCTLKEKGIQPERTIKVVSLTDEEGARFDYAFVGSTALVGTEGSKKLKENLASATDKDGISYLETMKQASLEGEYFNQINPDLLEQAQLGKNDVKAYIEVHIEQGKVLENKDLAVGIVTGISGGEWAEVTIMGEAGHAGTTWMKERKDALTAAAECILAIEKIALDNIGSVATVGKLEVKPGSSNVIPGRVDFTLDVRDISNERRENTVTKIYNSIRTIAANRDLGCEIRQVQSLSSVMSSPIVMKAVKDSLQELQYPVYELPSGAAHDAMVLGGLTDIGMIFVRSHNGISHHPDEWSSFEDVALGCEVLFRTTLKLL
ncbi:M20 family metallo-hydrolase [Bacillus sp. ISL-40]|uniref:M20 family metallo-hydrolase n=1 Tax=unclassified Bacillus (in: firmicutes) TaxID=185979 RepID=UPI001BE5D0F6|nr:MULTISPECIES: M20 family metallo-hydrolase [unclassified Bacillus (in: firmicutes)]MBT2698519.1 M20 family metallo-hydrolase [Bacillus sp. ISL-40]MBT2720152.1 M20 family metallo-hydrolase [Bacillus sp. ISL-46]MBT2739255.1 M20 family metallo-hydrolase [Bacillus sp. ISL-77]